VRDFLFGMLLVFNVTLTLKPYIMKSYAKKCTTSHGNEKQEHHMRKHDANLRKNGLLHFQIGLIISLLTSYLLLEAGFPVLQAKTDEVKLDLIEFLDEPPVPDFVPYVPPTEKQPIPDAPPPIDPIEITIIDDGPDKNETKVAPTEPDVIASIDSIAYIEPIIDVGSVPYEKVEVVPIFPGCESLSTNKERRICMSKAINKIVQKNFKTSLGEFYGLSGKQRINVQFKINKEGKVSDVKVRGTHPALEKEAKRVVHLIPDMKPGKQRDKKVEVIFLKPIIFNVQ